MAQVISNQFVDEGTASAGLTISLPWPSLRVEIINDSASLDLGYKFNSGEDYATLQPLEIVNIDMHTSAITLNGTGAYRVRVRG